MHEFSLAQSIHEIALEEARRHRGVRVVAVNLRIGVLRQIVPSLLESAFESVSSGTPLAGVVLRIEVEPVRTCCTACGHAAESEELSACCAACGSPRIRFYGGMEMQVTSLSVEDKESCHEHTRAAQRA
jgi:hydrogenase nickel incorporation protein HypA/HybF